MFGRRFEEKIDAILVFVLLVYSFFLHRGYFYPGIMTKGDWDFHFKEEMISWFFKPCAWLPEISTSAMKTMWLTFYPIAITYGFFAKILSFDFGIVERILFFFPASFLPAISMYYLTRYLFKRREVCLFSAILYSSNTYILLSSITHLTVAMAYSLTPLIIAFFIQSLHEKSLRKSVLASVVFTISMAYEARITYITAATLVLYLLHDILLHTVLKRDFSEFLRSLKMFIIFMVASIALSAYWILPFILGGGREAFASRLPSKPWICLLYTSPSPRDLSTSRMPSSA